MHYIEVYFCQQSEFGDSADSSTTPTLVSHHTEEFEEILFGSNECISKLRI